MWNEEFDLYFTDNRRAHLKMIQDVVERLARNSFQLKQWSVITVPALVAFLGKPIAAENPMPVYVAMAAVPAMVFWALDGFYLAREREFRQLYNAAAAMRTTVPLFSLRPAPLRLGGWLRACSAVTVGTVHGALVALVLTLDYVWGGVFMASLLAR